MSNSFPLGFFSQSLWMIKISKAQHLFEQWDSPFSLPFSLAKAIYVPRQSHREFGLIYRNAILREQPSISTDTPLKSRNTTCRLEKLSVVCSCPPDAKGQGCLCGLDLQDERPLPCARQTNSGWKIFPLKGKKPPV
jgi:hypothetical protein